MPRILLNTTCNLDCSYCFAKDFRAQPVQQISLQDFAIAISFFVQRQVILLAGGEPTIHKYFTDLMAVAAPFKNIHYFGLLTNGLFRPDILQHTKDVIRTYLINVNSRKDIGEKNWVRLLDNLNVLSNLPRVVTQIGINIYEPDFDFTFIEPLLERYKLYKQVRVGLANPTRSFSNQYIDPGDYLKAGKTLVAFTKFLVERGYRPSFDCPIPPCVWDMEDYFYILENGLNLNPKGCEEITIYPDLTVGHCFASLASRYNLSDFTHENQIMKKIMDAEKGLLEKVYAFPECKNCQFLQMGKCQTGCLAFSLREAKRANKAGTKHANSPNPPKAQNPKNQNPLT